MRIGIVGLPNAGKSSLFNALTRAGVEAANYPFTTIEPNIAVVGVRDERLDALGWLRNQLTGRGFQIEIVGSGVEVRPVDGLMAPSWVRGNT